MASRSPRFQLKSVPKIPKTSKPKEPSTPGESKISDGSAEKSVVKKVPLVPGTTIALARTPLLYMDQLAAVESLLREHLLVCDAKFAMFYAAAQVFDCASNLQPLPPMYSGEISGLHINKLFAILHKVPPLQVVLEFIDEKNFAALKPHVVELLYWVLVSIPQPPMTLLDETEFCSVVGKLNLKSPFPKPTHVFELGSKPTQAVRTIQTDASITRSVFVPVNFAHAHVVTTSGFKLHLHDYRLAAISVFWELSDAIKHGHHSRGWLGSQCGFLINCVVLCELAMGSQFVQTVKTGALVKHGELLTPRYLLFYSEQLAAQPPAPIAPLQKKRNPYISFVLSVLPLAAIAVLMYLKKFYSAQEIWNGFVLGVKRLMHAL